MFFSSLRPARAEWTERAPRAVRRRLPSVLRNATPAQGLTVRIQRRDPRAGRAHSRRALAARLCVSGACRRLAGDCRFTDHYNPALAGRTHCDPASPEATIRYIEF